MRRALAALLAAVAAAGRVRGLEVPMSLPKKIGVVGVGTISSATVRGLCRAYPGTCEPSFVLSPRNAAKGAALVEEFGAERITIAADNQAVVDAADCVIVAVLPAQAEAVLSALTIPKETLVVSLMASVKLATLKSLTGCDRIVVCCPLPAIATGDGCTLVVPGGVPEALAIYESLGTAVPVDDEDQYRRLQAMTCLMGDLYERMRTAQTWLTDNGVAPEPASKFVGGIFRTITTDAKDATPPTLDHLVAEQTPGGMNEMVIAEQRADGSYASLTHSLNSIHSRLSGAHDPGLAPANKRQKTD